MGKINKLQELKLKMGEERYDFSQSNYKNNHTSIIVIDRNTNTEHLLNPKSILQSRFDNYCTIRNAINQTEYAKEEFKLIYKDKYDYSKWKYLKQEKSWLRIITIRKN